MEKQYTAQQYNAKQCTTQQYTTPQQTTTIDEGIDPTPSIPTSSVSIPTEMITSLVVSMGFIAMMFKGVSQVMPKSSTTTKSSGISAKKSTKSTKGIKNTFTRTSTPGEFTSNRLTAKKKDTSNKKHKRINASKQTIADLNDSIEEEQLASAAYRKRAARLLSESYSPDDDTDTAVRLYLHIADEELHHKQEFEAMRNTFLGIEDQNNQLDIGAHLDE